MIGRTLRVALGAVLGGGFYLLLIDTTSLPELYVLAGVVLACALAFEISREEAFEEARVNPAWLLRAWRLVIKIPLDIALVCWEALEQLVRPRGVRGTFRAVRFDAVEPTPDGTARRALAEGLGSLAPNTVVVGVDDERRLLLVHQLRRQGEAKDLDVLRLG